MTAHHISSHHIKSHVLTRARQNASKSTARAHRFPPRTLTRRDTNKQAHTHTQRLQPRARTHAGAMFPYVMQDNDAYSTPEKIVTP